MEPLKMRSGRGEQERESQKERINALVGNLMDGNYYGKLLFCFESGKVTSVKKEESIKI